MTDFAAVVRARLIAAVTSAAGRVTWGDRPQGAALPAVVLTMVSDPRARLLNGRPNRRRSRVQADCFAVTHTAAFALAEQVLAAFDDRFTRDGIRVEPGEHEGPRTLTEDIPGSGPLHRAQLDLFLWH